MASKSSPRWVLFLAAIFFILPVCTGQLSTSFYSTSCSNLTAIVSRRVDAILQTNIGMAAGFLRLFFHDCFVRGCDASVLISSTSANLAEKDSTPNLNSLIGFVEIDAIKADVEAQCPNIVSCADILALAAEHATSKLGNVSWPVALGRRDGLVSLASDANANLPQPTFNFGQLVASFATFGLDTKDMIVLSAAHTIGRTRCLHIIPRLYNFNGGFNSTDPALDTQLAALLKSFCPQNSPSSFSPMDSTNTTFDNAYFVNVLARKGVLQSDAELINNPSGVQIINSIQANSSFTQDFAASMVKLGNIQVLTGAAGEIRKKCSAIN